MKIQAIWFVIWICCIVIFSGCAGNAINFRSTESQRTLRIELPKIPKDSISGYSRYLLQDEFGKSITSGKVAWIKRVEPLEFIGIYRDNIGNSGGIELMNRSGWFVRIYIDQRSLSDVSDIYGEKWGAGVEAVRNGGK